MVRIQHWFGGVGGVTQWEGRDRYVHVWTFVHHCIFAKNKKSSPKTQTPNRNKIKSGLTPINGNLIAPKSLLFYTRHVTNFILKSHQELCEKGTCELALREMLSFFYAAFKATFTCDDSMELFADDTSLGNDNNDWHVSFTYGNVPGNTRVLSVIGTDVGGGFGILGSTTNGLLTNESWKCTGVLYPGWNSPDFDDQNWPSARVFGVNSADSPWGKMISGIETTAKWIWAADHNNGVVYCRLNLR